MKRVSPTYIYCLLIVLITSNLSFSQASNFGCETGAVGSSEYVPTFNINLSASPSASASQPIVIPSSGFGECCGQANNVNCFVLAITLNPGAQGIQFNLSGASGNADIWYSNCSIGPFNIGYTFCVSGVGPHYFTFCRTGSTDYGVVVQSIAAPSNSGNIVTQNGCIDNFIVYGLQESSITWNSISPGTTGQYNNYLSNMQGGNVGSSGVTYTNQDSVRVTPPSGAPTTIQYQVCGNTIGTVCAASVPYCATVTASIVPTLGAAITPSNPVLCSSNPSITATPSGGQGPFTYLWAGPSNNGATTASITPTVAGTYTVTINDASGCPPVTASTTVLSSPIVVGTSNQAHCLNQNSLSTSFTSANANTTFTWTNDNTNTGIPASGSGNLPAYLLTGVGVSTITVTPTLYGCVGTPSIFTITVNALPNVNAGPDQLICANSTTSVTATGASTYVWNPNVTNGVNFTATTSGTYTVTGTDGNGCQNTDNLVITFDNIPPTASNLASQNVQCSADVPAPNVNLVADEADNYGSPTVTWLSDVTSGSCPTTLTRTYRVTDQCGNFINVTQLFTIVPSTNPVIPANGNSTVSCPSLSEVQPSSPTVTDACGNILTPTITSSSNISCEGTKTWTFTYADCAGNTSIWTYTYTIDYSGGLTAPANGSSTVSCPSAAFDPGAPANITDACGRTVSAVLVGQDAATPACEGTVVWRYRYTACDGTTTADWIYTYTIDYSGGLTAPANGSSTVSCPSAAVNPGAPANITDACGRTVSAVLVGQDAATPACEGTVVWRYRYTACDGTTTADWIYTYTIDYSGGLTAPANGSSTVSCPSAAVDPGAPANITDACGRTVSAVLVGQDAATPACEGTVVWRYRYTACDGTTTADWIYTYTIDYSGGLTAPANGSSTVLCPSAAVNPGTPANITDACGRTVSAVLVGQDAATPACEGTVVWRYRYTACDGTTTADWIYTYTIDYSGGLTAPANGSSTVSCPSAAVDPGAPANITDACGRTVSAVLVGQDAATPACEGTVVWRYRYTACDGTTTADWIYTYTIDYSGGLTAPANGSSTVSCPSAAVNPGAPANITDACGRTVSAVLVGQDAATPACEGTVVWRYRYTACDGTTTADWIYTYTIDYSGGLTAPANGSSTVSCPSAAVNPGAPANITDACGRTVSAVLVGQDAATPACEGTVVWRYRYTACDGTTTADWIFTYTINENIVPTASNPAPVAVQCSADVPAPDVTLVNDEADNCTAAPIVQHVGDVSDGNTCPEVITRTYSVTDNCGNAINVTQTITVDDTTLPTASNPTTTTIPAGPAPAPDPTIVIDEADNCTLNPVVAFVSESSDGGNCPETITRIYSVTDDCGNTINVTHLIVITDLINPTASNPAGVNVQCLADVPAPDITVVIDELDNGGVPTVAFVSDVSDGNTCPEVITRTYSVTDNCGNAINVTQTITIDDTTPPTASNPASVAVQCSADVPAPDVTVVLDEADNCSVPTVAFVSDVSDGNTCPEVITRTYSVTDNCGNTINVTQTITVDDTTLPTASNPAPIAVQCSADVPAPDVTLVNDEADNCSVPTVAFVSDVSDGNTCPEVITRTYSVTDNCGNAINVTQTITIDDTTLPTASNPAPLAVQCSADLPAPDVTVVLDEADNCSVPTVAFVSDVSDGNICPEVITRTYSVTDNCGNAINVTQTITVDDTTLPTASNPAPVAVQCSADVPAPDVTVVLDEADNCTAAPIVQHVGDVSDGNTCPEVITRTYSVTDNCGNTINVTQTITIDDTTPPTASNPTTTTIPAGPAPAPDPTIVIDEADNCTLNPVVAFVSESSDGGNCPETITRIYSVTDDCGNTINVSHLIVITDLINPTASNPAGVNVQCLADVPAPDITVVIDELDNGGVPTVAFVSDVSDGNTCPEVITRTYSITDNCGNTINVTQTITVDDTTLPTASNPASVAVQCSADVPAPDVTVVLDEADNCTATPTVAFVSDVSDGNTCPEVITRTYSVTDNCGNAINVTQTITVDDTTLPTASNPTTTTIPAGPAPAPDPTIVIDEADNCTLNPVVAFVSESSDGGNCPETITRIYSVTDDCGNTINVSHLIVITDLINPTASNPAGVNVQCLADVPAPDITVVIDELDNGGVPTVAFVSDVSDGNTCPEVITRTYSVTDNCGNTINVTQTITVDDTTLPTASNPASVAVQCSADLPAPDVTVVLDEADNCTATPTVAFVSDVSDGNTCPEVITRTYSVTDNCGNAINVTQTITIDDTTLPTASNPAPLAVQCSADLPAPDVTVVLDEADNCSVPTVAFVSDVSDGNTCPEVITRTYSVTDNCGNAINVTQTITVDDTTLPTASNPAPVAVQCSADVPAPDVTVVLDEADNCTAAPIVQHVGDLSDGNTCPEVITRTYSVTDNCGNTINVTQTITIDDTTPPTASNPTTTTIPAGPAPAPDPTIVIDEADNCTLNPVVAFVSESSDGGNCPETITRIYSVTDDCGNTINVSHLIVITDLINPTASNPAGVTVQCSADVPAPDITVVIDELDNGGVPTVAFVSDVSDGNTCPEVIIRTYSVTDNCGNTINVTQTITVDDTTLPTASNPAPIAVQCSADVPAPDVTVVLDEADNCTAAPIVQHVGDVSDGNTCPEVITRTYSVTDNCGNAINVTQTITVDDTTLPTASNPAPLAVQCSADVSAPDVTVVLDEADNCTAAPIVQHVGDVSDGNTCPEVITRTYSVTDNCGNAINVTQTITVDDTTLPTASNPAPVAVQCSADVPAPDVTVVLDEADNCTATPTVAFVSDVSDGNTCPEVITRTYSVTDNCGNAINVTQTITVDDTTLPTASNPASVAVQCSADVPAPDVTVVLDEADNCSVPTVAFVSDVSDGNTCPEVITRTYSVTDNCGNTINVTQTITVDDTTLPTASNPAPIAVQCSADVPAPDVTLVNDEADNCSVPTVAFVSDVSDGNTCPEVITRTYSVTDNCGNTINVTQTITVDDTTLPTASNPASVAVQCSADLPAPDVTVVLDEADNCTATPTVAFVSDVSDGNTCPEVITRTYSVTDNCGNAINVTQTITIDDTTLPTASNPAPLAVQCSADLPAPDVTVVLDEADNCSVPTVAFVSDVSDGNTCPEVITRTYSVTDNCGNAINVTQTITVDDTTLPTASNPAPVAVQCSADVPAPDVTVVLDEADNCTAAPIVQHVGDLSDGNTCPEVITRTYSVTDNCGNTINVTQTITIDDTTPPTASNPTTTTIPAGPAPAPDPTIVIDEADNCTLNPVVAFVSESSDGGNCPETITRIYSVTDDCGNTINVSHLIVITDLINPTASNPAGVTVQCSADVPAPDITVVIDELDNGGVPTVAFVSDVSDGNTCPEVIIRTYSVTDNCGNTINVTQTITVDDTTLPTASNPAPIAVQCSADVPAPDVTVVLDEADNCTAAPIVQHVGDVSDGNTCPEVITRTYSVTDNCGNAINVTQTITVDDTTLPTASNPAPLAVQCSADVSAPDVTVVLDEADNCTAAPIVQHVGDVSDGNTCPEVITRTYSVTDNCGNAINVTQTITVDDTTLPTASNPAPVAVQCSADVPAPDVTVVLDEADNCTATPTVAFVSDVSDGNTCPEVITRTYSVTDNCGNAINVTQTITVDDTTLPTASNPASVAVQCSADVPAPDVTVVLDEADNCSVPTVAFVSDVSDGNTCPEVITRTYSVTDNCGNTINVTQTITIDDTTLPTASNPAPLAVQCSADLPAPDVTVVLDEADNCSVPTVAFVSDVSDGNTCPEVITRTYSVTDNCGNAINVTQTITIDDTTLPTASNPAPVAVQCSADVPAPDVTVVLDEADNCTAAPIVQHVGDVSDGNTCPEVITRTYSVTDNCGNTINVTQTITIDDTTPPTASNPTTTTIPAGPAPAPDPTIVIDEADNCTLNPVVAFVSESSDGGNCPETITRIYSVTDDCGNTINVSHLIVITDLINPTASNPAGVNVQCLADVPAPDITVVIDELDNGGVPTVAFVSDVSDGNTCPEVITRTYSITDNCGNTINVTQTITVDDTTLPTASNPASVAVQCSADLPAPDVTVVLDEADNCTATPTVAFVSDVSDGNTCPEVITRTYSVTDNCGNAINVTQTITIDDTTLPTASNPAPLAVQCSADLPAPDVTVVLDEADNCSVPTVAFVSDVSDGNTCPEVITRTYSVTDNCGNAINVTQTITVDDTTLPTASNPAPVAVQCSADVPAPDVTVVLDEADNCTATPTVAFVSDVSDGNTCPEVITRTYSVTDNCGNAINVTQTITVDDTTLPTASNPTTTTIPAGPAPAPDPTIVIDEADNCTLNPVVAFVSESSDGGNCPETITRIYSVTDDCGNTINVSHLIVITDLINPTASNPAGVNVQCLADVPAPDITVVIDELDNGGVPTVAFVSDVSDGNTCPEVITRTYSVTDNCGNTINVTQTITVDDTTLPTASNPASVAVQCSADLPAPDVTVVLDEADNCTATPTVAFVSDVSDGNTCPEVITRTYSVTDNCGNAINVTQTITIDDTTLPTASNPAPLAVQCSADLPAPDVTVVLDEADNCSVPTVAFVSDVSDGNTCPEVITRTYSVTDNCGNAINVTQTITVDDTTLPTASNPAPVAVQCSADVPAPDVTVVLDEADNCTAAPIVQHVGDLSDGNTCPEVITRTYSVTDNCGNTINVTQTITIDDTTPPTASNPASVAVQCSADVPAPDVTVVLDEADNCSVPTVAFVSDVSDGNTCSEVITRTYSVTDNCGNTINVTQTITVDDTTPPTASNPAPVFVECPEDIPAPNPSVVTDENDNCGVLSVTWTTDQVNNVLCPVVTRIYTITDFCGNTTQVSQVITVTDNENPTFEVEDTLYISGTSVPPVDIGVISNLSDNCAALPTVIFIGETTYGNCPQYIDRVYRVIDNCGNFVDATHTIVFENLENQVQANFSFSPTNVSALNSTIQFLNSSTNATNYQWYFGDGTSSTQFEPIHEYDDEYCTGFIITLIASDGNCRDTAINVIPCTEETIFYVPNTFTPDGDNFNQTFFPVFYSGFDPFNFEMLIFDRWGELIFETHNVKIGWDGTYGNLGRKVQDGVYTWKIIYKKRENDSRHVVVGHVNLLR